MAQFEVFSKALVHMKREPTVTIQKNGAISLNKAAQAALGSPAAVELLYDQKSRTMGIRVADPHVDHTFALRSPTGQDTGPFVLSARAFLRHYGIEADVSRRWQAYLDEDGVLCADLNDAYVVVTSNRARKAHVTSQAYPDNDDADSMSNDAS